MRRLGGVLLSLLTLLLGLSHPANLGAVDLGRSPAPPFVAFTPVQEGFTTDGLQAAPFAEDRLLVQLSGEALSAASLSEATRSGQATGGPEIGLPSLDAIGREVGLIGIRRASIVVRNEQLDRELGIGRWFLFLVPGGTDILRLVERYRADPQVEAATPDWRAFPAAVPNDPLHPDHWGHNNTAQMKDYCWGCGGHDNGTPVGTVGFDADAQSAWDGSQGYGASSVVIAILDSGVDTSHPDLRLVTGYDYGDDDADPNDDSAQPGHGTACAGVAAAVAGNGIGPAGIAGGCSVMPLKVANSSGQIYFSYIQNALYHAADNGADVASMSLGAAITNDPATDAALQYAYNAGVVLLAATGNENAGTINYPANNQYVIAVGAAQPCDGRKRSSSDPGEVNPGVNTDPNGYTCDGERWWGSNYGTNSPGASGAVDILAPTILPTTDISGSGGYDAGDYSMWFNGTSCSTPYAAGVAALVKSAQPSFTPAQIRQSIVSSATDVINVESVSGWDRYSGYGLVNAAGAVGGGGPAADYATLPYETGFESGAVDVYWSSSSTADGRVRVLSTNGPHSGGYHLTLDDATNGGFSLNESWLHLDLSGETDVDLEFWWKEFGDETHTQDGVYFSDDGGGSFVKVQDLNGQSYTNNTWELFQLDLDQLAAANGLSLSGTFVVKFQQYDNYPMTYDGFAFDDISVTAGAGGGNHISAESEPNDDAASADGPVGDGLPVTGTISSSSDDDWFYFDVQTPGIVTIVLDIHGSADLDWYLYYETDLQNWVARGYTVNNPESGQYDCSVGRYYLWVDGYQGATSDYTLTISGGGIALPMGPEKLDLSQLPQVFDLAQNAPNPFRPATTIRLALPQERHVRLRIYEVTGRVVRVLIDQPMKPGYHAVDWDGRDESGRPVASGVYLYRVEAGDFVATRKMIRME